jgi:hypothetical protein
MSEFFTGFGFFLGYIYLLGLIVCNLFILFFMFMVKPPRLKLYPFMFIISLAWFVLLPAVGYAFAKVVKIIFDNIRTDKNGKPVWQPTTNN